MLRRPKGAIAGGVFALAAAMPMPLWAQIKTDGTVGTARSLVGPNFAIGADLGRQVGGNLFHSFTTFNLKTGESATFTGPNSVANVIGRVTGGTTSSVDGKIASTIPRANLFLINPAGWVFGPHASLDVQGSFHVSSADYLRHSDGARFQATTPNGSTFTSAPPEAFGFLGPNAGKISINGSSLVTLAGRSLSAVGGDIEIAGARVAAPAGQLDIVSVAGPGDIGVNPADATKLTVQTFGSVDITSGATVEASDQASLQGGGGIYIRGGAIAVDRSLVRSQIFGDTPGKPMSIQADNLSLSNGSIVGTSTLANGAGGPVTVSAGSINISKGEIETRSEAGGAAGPITASTGQLSITGSETPGQTSGQVGLISRNDSSGGSGGISVNADTITMNGDAQISSATGSSGNAGNITVNTVGAINIDGHDVNPVGIGSIANTGSTGAAGKVLVQSDSLSLAAGGQIATDTFGAGPAGSVRVSTRGPISIDARANAPTGIQSNAHEGSTGNAGVISVDAGSISISAVGAISSSTFGTGNGGTTSVSADKIYIDGSMTNSAGNGTGIFSDTNKATGGGQGGNVFVQANDIETKADGLISSRTFGNGNAGAVTVTGPSGTGQGLTMILDGTNARLSSGITSSAEPGSTGRAGTVNVMADHIAMKGSAEISSDSIIASGDAGNVNVTANDVTVGNQASISTTAALSLGNGGNISLKVGQLSLQGQDATVSALDLGPGRAGDISIDADRLIVDKGSITTSALVGDGGNININANSLFYVNRGMVTTTVHLGVGRGGNIMIDPPLIALNDGTISANGNGGPGGNITVLNPFIETPKSTVTASSSRSTAGTITIATPVSGLASNLAPLVEKGIAAHAISHTACDAAARVDKAPSTIVMGGRGGLPDDADGPQDSSYFTDQKASAGVGPPMTSRPPFGASYARPTALSSAPGGGYQVRCAAK